MADRRPDRAAPDDSETEESFLARWSRRKRASGSDTPAVAQDATEPAAETPQPAAEPEAQEPEFIDDELPPVESLGPDSDYSAYLSNRVSEGLRRAALRKLFGQPAFNLRDGLDDYDDDYRSFAALGDIVTADMRHHKERLMEKERQRERDRLAARDVDTGELPTAESAPGSDAGPDPESAPDPATDSEIDADTDGGHEAADDQRVDD